MDEVVSLKGAVGVVAEFDPFHAGHMHLLQALRAQFPEKGILCVMSESLTQRGMPACLPGVYRARAALQGGADLVLSLPPAVSLSPAAHFAAGAVAILSATGIVTHLGFGSETCDAAFLERGAEASCTQSYDIRLREGLSRGLSYGVSGCRALSGLLQAPVSPNDLLGMSYIRALRARSSAIVPVPVQRVGAGHNASGSPDCPSASAVRGLLQEGCPPERLPLPECSRGVFAAAAADGAFPLKGEKLDGAVLAALTVPRPAYTVPDGGEGLLGVVRKRACSASALEELAEACACRRYSVARVRRCIWQYVLGITPELQQAAPVYLRLLAANRRGFGLLRQIRECAALPLVQRAVALRDFGPMGESELYAASFVSLGLPRRQVPEQVTPFYEK